jgi:GTPase SAR1 family protein
MDVASSEDYARMRESIYKSVDVVIFCFSLSDIEMTSVQLYSTDSTKESKQTKKRGSSSHISLGNVKTIWLPEFEKALGKEQHRDSDPNPDEKKKENKLELPIKILVGTKGDQLFEETSLLAKDQDDDEGPISKLMKK